MTYYPISFTVQNKPFLTLREDEAKWNGVEHTYEIADALERKFWELANDQLEELKEFYEDVKSVKMRKEMFALIDKVLSQRKFMQDNKALREALKP